MKRILKSKKGLSLLEGLIALMLLALVATGAFTVLLSTSRKTSEPDIREEMALAVEKAQQMLQIYVYPDTDFSELETDIGSHTVNFSQGLCGTETEGVALDVGTHGISCLLPPVCDEANSSFVYMVSEVAGAGQRPRHYDMAKQKYADGTSSSTTPNMGSNTERKVEFTIVCNGYTL